MDAEIVSALEPVAAIFRTLGVRFQIGGSVASSALGLPRSTLDIDLVAALQFVHVAPFTTALQGDYYVDEVMIREAIMARASFNMIHLATMLKLDVFIPKRTPFHLASFNRSQSLSLGSGDSRTEFPSSTAEDIILHKLDCYRLGGEVSERQWGDVLGVLRVQGDRLDDAYLDGWAHDLELTGLLGRARAAVTEID